MQNQSLKIGILTFHRCINYGSYWQARCLAEGLQQMGHQVEVLNHHSAKINLAEWKCAYQPTLPEPTPVDDLPLYRRKIEKFFNAFNSLPLSQRFSLYRPEQMKSYDIVVVGSDEVWNLLHPWYSNLPVFYGEGIHSGKIVSYAASFGNYPAIWGLNNTWSQRLQNFDSISVRDENSWWLVKNATGTEPTMVLDPCLQFDIPISENSFAEKKYLAVYGHNFSDDFIRQAKKFATSKRQTLISIGYRNEWADENYIAAGPMEFAPFIASASAVLTNFFHGCVFALRFQKPFACEASNYRSNKVLGLMNLLQGTHHFFDANDRKFMEQRLQEPLRPGLLQTVSSLRRSSQEYLMRSLEKDQLQVA